jgi:hypothetical protein
MVQDISQEFTTLNEQQLDMLRLFKSPMPDADFKKIKLLVVQLLSKKLDNVMDKWEIENNITEDTYEKWSNEHRRSSYKKTE